MTKVEAIKSVMEEYNGIASLQIIYKEIEKYYPNIKKSSDWQAGIRGVLYRDIGKSFKKLDNSVYSLIDYNEINLLPDNFKDLVPEKEVIAKVRTLQQSYRKKLLNTLKFCPITGISDKRLLVASHIKPWCISSSEEKLDIFNGFILSPLYDKLFDSGLITFTDKKEMILSSTLSEDTIKKLNIKNGIYSDLPINGREKYLDFHNQKIFIE
ncbi:MAG: HNH endonuclease [Acutalibacteraceae bacterium]